MKVAVVVGANGFLGSALVNKLLLQGFEVIAVYNTNTENINPKAKLLTTDALFNSSYNPDYIFYLSGNYSNPHDKLLQINDTLYHYSLKYVNAKMVYVSSTNVYGNTDKIVTENSPFWNPGLYALSKLAGEFIVKAMAHYAILRMAYIYGPGITNTSFIPAIIASAKNNKKITLFGKGEREQDYIYVDDAVNLCLAAALQEDNAIYLGATGTSFSNKKVAEVIQRHIACALEFVGEETGQSFFFNPKQTFDKLHWQPETSLEEGIKNMLV
jgi:UDP-glucose 4-epimerase